MTQSRENRPGDSQPMPTSREDSQDVTIALIADISNIASESGKGWMVTVSVCDDLQRRSDVGKKRYGTSLRTFNGRSAALDAYEESLDMCQYIKQLIMEKPFSQRHKFKNILRTAIGLAFELKEEVIGESIRG